jgi:glycolate oxidase
MQPLDRAVLALSRALGDSVVRTDAAACEAAAHDESEAEWVMPAAVVGARDADDVATVLRVCHDLGVAVFPRGAGTGRVGGATVTAPGLVLDTTAIKSLDELDTRDGLAVVGPGMVTAAFQSAVEAEGMFYPPDPQSAAWCTLGGNLATNAGGPRALKYGVTRDWVLGLEAVLPGGERVSTGRSTRKGVTGYDLPALLVGSEGTLAVITRATLRLTALPTAVVGVWARFGSVAEAGAAVVALSVGGMRPRCVELLDAVCCATLSAQAAGLGLEGAGALLVMECDGHDARAVEAEAERVAEACAAAGAEGVSLARDPVEREALWAARRVMSRALRARARWKLSEDVVVPVTRVPALLEAVRGISAAEGVVMPTYGHAGDGNLHVNLLWDDPAAYPAVQRAIAALFRATLSLGGTLSGEHGIGVLKAPYLPWEQSEGLIALQRRVKAAFDPRGVLNPGKVLGPGTHSAC